MIDRACRRNIRAKENTKAAPAGAINTDERLSRTPQLQELMHMISVSENSLSPSAPTHNASSDNKVGLADAATMLLPGLQQSRLLPDAAIRTPVRH